MYEDPIPHYSPLRSSNTRNNSPTGGYDVSSSLSSLEPDQELQRLHQHQLLIQLRLEVNSLRTQIQQLELLKQQLMHQRQMMQPAEYEQLMDQFSRTTQSLLRVGNPSHFGDGSCQQLHVDRIGGGFGSGNGLGGAGAGAGAGIGGLGPGSGGESYVGMHMMERLQEKLRSMAIQQHQHQFAHRQRQQQKQQQLQQQLHQQGTASPTHDMEMDTDAGHSGYNTPTRRDPVRMEQISLEADLRDLEKRMRSIQLLR